MGLASLAPAMRREEELLAPASVDPLVVEEEVLAPASVDPLVVEEEVLALASVEPLVAVALISAAPPMPTLPHTDHCMGQSIRSALYHASLSNLLPCESDPQANGKRDSWWHNLLECQGVFQRRCGWPS